MIKLINILKELVTATEVICDNCGWEWKIAQGGKDPYLCHKCSHDNTPKKSGKK
jgi:tRNA(Ile2) C34 agmatinyltransferase TiaS